MSKVTVYSPVPGYSGRVLNLEFVDGKASVDESDHQALAYFRRHDYGIGERPKAKAPASPDPREVGEGGSGADVVGTRLRDAAVDPDAADFLPPTNAGKANPHGPEVVAPGIHAVPPAPIVPGSVSSTAKVQERAETEVAEAALVEQRPAGEAAVAAGDEEERPSTKARSTKARSGTRGK